MCACRHMWHMIHHHMDTGTADAYDAAFLPLRIHPLQSAVWASHVCASASSRLLHSVIHQVLRRSCDAVIASNSFHLCFFFVPEKSSPNRAVSHTLPYINCDRRLETAKVTGFTGLSAFELKCQGLIKIIKKFKSFRWLLFDIAFIFFLFLFKLIFLFMCRKLLIFPSFIQNSAKCVCFSLDWVFRSGPIDVGLKLASSRCKYQSLLKH